MEEVEEEESVGERYAKMAKHDKLALLMIALGPDAASTLLKRFDAQDAEKNVLGYRCLPLQQDPFALKTL